MGDKPLAPIPAGVASISHFLLGYHDYFELSYDTRSILVYMKVLDVFALLFALPGVLQCTVSFSFHSLGSFNVTVYLLTGIRYCDSPS